MPRHTAFFTPVDRERIGVSSRTSRRGTYRKHFQVLRWVLLLVLLGLLVLGIQNAYSALSGSDFFRVEQISVIGNRLLTPSDVVHRSGLKSGGNLFEADLKAATERLGSHPVIRGALLLRQPPGTLVISVAERHPIALVITGAGARGLDHDGDLFPLPPAPLDLPVLTGLLEAGSDSSDAHGGPQLSRTLRFLEDLEARVPGFLDGVSEVHVQGPDEARVYLLADGLELRMRLERAGEQACNLRSYLASVNREDRPNYVDLRFRDQVVVGK